MKDIILGIGNTLNSDDGVGVYIAERISKHLKKTLKKPHKVEGYELQREIVAINCGTTPENYTSVIKRHHPDKLIVVDAADMGLKPGSCRIVAPEKIGVMHISTHNIPLSVFASYVREYCQDITLIGIQPDTMDIGTALSSAVKKSGDYIATLIVAGNTDKIRPLE